MVLCFAAVLTFASMQLSGSLLGTPPSNQHAAVGHSGASSNAPIRKEEDAETKTLRSAVEKNPSDIAAKKSLVAKLWDSLSDEEYAPSNVVLDIIDLLGQILEVDPNDKNALMMMANLSFNQKVFEKSATYYKRYLDLAPDDFEARSSYASSLTFLGKFDDALKELDSVIKKRPDYFQALAYKTITLAQMGKIQDAAVLGRKALLKAPSDEARQRFTLFLDSLSATDVQAQGALNNRDGDPVTTLVKNHPVTGNKFVRSEKKPDGSLTLYMSGFPMDQMPQAMKDSYLAKIRAAAASDSTIKSVLFVDTDSGQTLARVDITQ